MKQRPERVATVSAHKTSMPFSMFPHCIGADAAGPETARMKRRSGLLRGLRPAAGKTNFCSSGTAARNQIPAFPAGHPGTRFLHQADAIFIAASGRDPARSGTARIMGAAPAAGPRIDTRFPHALRARPPGGGRTLRAPFRLTGQGAGRYQTYVLASLPAGMGRHEAPHRPPDGGRYGIRCARARLDPAEIRLLIFPPVTRAGPNSCEKPERGFTQFSLRFRDF